MKEKEQKYAKEKVEHKEQITKWVNKRLWRNDYFSTCQLEVWMKSRIGLVMPRMEGVVM